MYIDIQIIHVFTVDTKWIFPTFIYIVSTSVPASLKEPDSYHFSFAPPKTNAAGAPSPFFKKAGLKRSQSLPLIGQC